MIDLPFIYRKKLLNKKEFLFYLLKTNKTKTFNHFFKDIEFHFKNKKDVKFINSLFRFSLKFNNLKSCEDIFKRTVKLCSAQNQYEVLTYQLLNITFNNNIYFTKYCKIIDNSWIDFYNSTHNNYKRKINTRHKKSYNIFMKHYDIIFDLLLEKSLSKEIIILQNTFHKETYHHQEKYIVTIKKYITNNENDNFITFFEMIQKNYERNHYFLDSLIEESFNCAFKNENFFVLSYYKEKCIYKINNWEKYLKISIEKESIQLLKFINKETSFFKSALDKLSNEDYFFYSPFYLVRVKSNDFLKHFLIAIQDCYTKNIFMPHDFNRLSENEKIKISKLSDIYFNLIQSYFRYSHKENKKWEIYSEYIDFSFITIDYIKELLKSNYMNNKNFTRLIEMNNIKNKEKSNEINNYISLLNNSKKVRNF